MPGSKTSAGSDEPSLIKVRGKLGRQTVRTGTASQHESWVVETKSHGTLLLKDIDANPFELGPPPAELGSQIEAEGYLVKNEIRYLRLRPL
jgi:hypothetical protein